MNISMHLAVAVAAAACLCVCAAAPENRLARTKQQRPTRGFKNVEMMTARGFGKRDRPTLGLSTRTAMTPTLAGSLTPRATSWSPTTLAKGVVMMTLLMKFTVWTTSGRCWRLHLRGKDRRMMRRLWKAFLWTGSSTRCSTIQISRDLWSASSLTSISIPLDWFVNEMLNNPDFARSVVRKFIDLNQDGMLSSEELLRNVV
nr:allatotropin [Spodoptera frugiperda]